MTLSNREDLNAHINEIVTRVTISVIGVALVIGPTFLECTGEWRLYEEDGILIDQHTSYDTRRSFQLWRLTGTTVVDIDVSVNASKFLTLILSGGYRLDLYLRPDGSPGWWFH